MATYKKVNSGGGGSGQTSPSILDLTSKITFTLNPTDLYTKSYIVDEKNYTDEINEEDILNYDLIAVSGDSGSGEPTPILFSLNAVQANNLLIYNAYAPVAPIPSTETETISSINSTNPSMNTTLEIDLSSKTIYFIVTSSKRATHTEDGLMSFEDKIKLDNLSQGSSETDDSVLDLSDVKFETTTDVNLLKLGVITSATFSKTFDATKIKTILCNPLNGDGSIPIPIFTKQINTEGGLYASAIYDPTIAFTALTAAFANKIYGSYMLLTIAENNDKKTYSATLSLTYATLYKHLIRIYQTDDPNKFNICLLYPSYFLNFDNILFKFMNYLMPYVDDYTCIPATGSVTTKGIFNETPYAVFGISKKDNNTLCVHYNNLDKFATVDLDVSTLTFVDKILYDEVDSVLPTE